MKNFIKQNSALILFIITILGLLVFPIWSHLRQAGQINGLVIQGNNGDQLAGGISRIAIGSQVKWTTDFIPSASFTVDLGSSTLPVDDIYTGDLFFNDELKPDGSTCSNGQILKKTGANDWDCAADATGSVSSNSLNFDEFQDPLVLDGNITTTSASFGWNFGATNLATIGSASFTRGFKIANGTGDNLFRITSAGTVNAGLWQGTAITDAFVNDAISIIGGTIGANSISGLQTTTGTTTFGDGGDTVDFATSTWDVASGVFTGGTLSTFNVTGTWTTTGNLTIGDNGDDVIIDSDTWNVDSAGVGSGFTGITTTGNFSGATASLSGNFQTSARIIGGTSSHSFGGSIEPSATGLGSLGTTAKKWSQAVVNLIQVAVEFLLPSRTATNVTRTGDLALDTASASLNYYDGTAERVSKDIYCFTYIVDTPTAANPGRVQGKRFNDPFTITSVQEVASGSNSAGWNILHGVPGTVTTTLFTVNKSASTSTYPTYTGFNDATLLDGEAMDLVITSRSATIQSFAVTICGRDVK